MTNDESLAARVEKLERRSRTWIVLCLLSLAAAPLLGAAAAERHVEAKGFVLRDAHGRSRAALVTTADGGTALSLRDAQGTDRISLAVAADGRPSLTVSDADAHPRVKIALAHEATLNFYDRRGKLRAVLGVSEYGPRRMPPRAAELRSESESANAFFQGGLASKPAAPKPDVMEEAAQMGPVLKLFDLFGTPSLEARVDVDRPYLMMQTRGGKFEVISPGRLRAARSALSPSQKSAPRLDLTPSLEN